MPFVGKTDNERRAAINTITGMEIRFGLLPQAVPYLPNGLCSCILGNVLGLITCALFLRPVGFDYRSKLENTVTLGIGDYV